MRDIAVIDVAFMDGVGHRAEIHCRRRTKERQIGDAIGQDAGQLSLRAGNVRFDHVMRENPPTINSVFSIFTLFRVDAEQ